MPKFSNSNLRRALPCRGQNFCSLERVDEILVEERVSYYNSVYSPIVTLWAMVLQALAPDKSLSNAVNQMIIWLGAAGVKPPSSDTGAYSKARQRLPEIVLQRLVPEMAEALEQQVPTQQQWCGRRVRICDGTTVLMSDTAANQAAYPQHRNSIDWLWISDCQTGGDFLTSHGCSGVRLRCLV